MKDNEWKKVCAACAEGTPPKRCAYYGDPDGCNAPTLGAHPEGDLAERLQEELEKAERRIAELARTPGDAAVMRDALKRILAIEGYGAPWIEAKCIAQKALEGEQYTPPIAQNPPKFEQPGDGGQTVDEDTSDGYHTFRELYRYRMLYNAAFFNMLARHTSIPVVKSHRHGDGELCFDGGWFIVMAQLPTGQVSNHYEDRFWELFNVPEAEKAPEWDGHTPNDAADRLESFLEMREPDSDKSNPPGNAAAMREALKRIVGWCEGCHADACEKVCRPELTSESIHAALAALAAPARNADRFADPGKAWIAYKAECDKDETVPNMIGAISWLLATAEGGAE